MKGLTIGEAVLLGKMGFEFDINDGEVKLHKPDRE